MAGGSSASGGGGITDFQSVPDGTVSSPGLAFENDQDTGWHRPSADTIQAVTNGDAEMELTSGGNLNIEGTLTESTTV